MSQKNVGMERLAQDSRDEQSYQITVMEDKMAWVECAISDIKLALSGVRGSGSPLKLAKIDTGRLIQFALELHAAAMIAAFNEEREGVIADRLNQPETAAYGA